MAKAGVFRVGGQRETIVLARELADGEKPPVWRAYLGRWAWQVKGLIDAPKGATDEQLAAIAPNHPAFEVRAQDR